MAYGQATYSSTGFLRFLESYGLTDTILPFFLIFLLTFAILQKTNLLGTNRKNFNAVFGIIMGLMVVMPHILGRYPPGKNVVIILNQALPNISVLAVAIIMLLFIVGIVAPNYVGSGFSGVVAMAAFVGVVYFFGAAAGWWNSMHYRWWGPDTTSLVIVILVFALVLWMILREPGHGEATASLGKNLKGLTDFFRGG